MSEVRELQIASRMEGITEVETLINQICEEFGVEEMHYGEILIAMTEAVNNAIVHGNKLDINKMVDVSVQTEGPKLQFRVTDQGPGFDFENIPRSHCSRKFGEAQWPWRFSDEAACRHM